jgi:hypothetical protein
MEIFNKIIQFVMYHGWIDGLLCSSCKNTNNVRRKFARELSEMAALSNFHPPLRRHNLLLFILEVCNVMLLLLKCIYCRNNNNNNNIDDKSNQQ